MMILAFLVASLLGAWIIPVLPVPDNNYYRWYMTYFAGYLAFVLGMLWTFT